MNGFYSGLKMEWTNNDSIKEALSFDDVIMEVQYSEVESRSKVDLSMNLSLVDRFTLPIISAPMDTVTGEEMAFRMDANGGLGILHRYCSIEEQVSMLTKALELCDAHPDKTLGIVGAAIGANGDYLERAKELVDNGVGFLCVDVAHGHHSIVRAAISEIKGAFPEIHLMVGNVATFGAFHDLGQWGANSVKVGISSGAACTTAVNTGHGAPTLHSIIECKSAQRILGQQGICVNLIADGGMKTPGDIAKAFAAGADFCMLGSMLAGTKAAPGHIIKSNDGKWGKEYRGSASYAAQISRGQERPRVEGVSTIIPYKGKIENVLDNIRDGLASACSYSGVERLDCLYTKAKFLRVTGAGYHQGQPHILK